MDDSESAAFPVKVRKKQRNARAGKQEKSSPPQRFAHALTPQEHHKKQMPTGYGEAIEYGALKILLDETGALFQRGVSAQKKRYRAKVLCFDGRLYQQGEVRESVVVLDGFVWEEIG